MNYVYLLCNGSMEVLKEEMVVAILGMHCFADYFNIKRGGGNRMMTPLVVLGLFSVFFLDYGNIKREETE